MCNSRSKEKNDEGKEKVMPKNKALIEQMKRLHQTVNNVTPEVYAGIALALHRKHGWGFQRINDLFALSQDIWTDAVNEGMNMRTMCYIPTP